MLPATRSVVGSVALNLLRAALAPRWRRLRNAFSGTLAAMVLLGAFTAHQVSSGPGGTFTVTTTADNTSGSTTAGSLRDGILAANSGGCLSPCTIQFAT